MAAVEKPAALPGPHSKRTVIASLAALLSVVLASSCCLPLFPFLFAAGAAGSSAFFVKVRPFLMAASFLFIVLGFYQASRAKRCNRHPHPMTTVLLWVSAVVVVAFTLFPQLMANFVANALAKWYEVGRARVLAIDFASKDDLLASGNHKSFGIGATSMTRKRIVFAGLIAILLATLYYMYAGTTVPAGQQPLLRLSDSNLVSLKNAFNESARDVRILLLVSPTWAVCLRGVSAINRLLEQIPNAPVRVFVVWEPVLPMDLAAPSRWTLRRMSDLRASQYWDKKRLVSKLLGEQDRSSVVWDYVAVYQPGTLWDHAPPDPAFSHVPVVRSVEEAKNAINQQLRGDRPPQPIGQRSVCSLRSIPVD